MDTKRFRALFHQIACNNGFKKFQSCWFIESEECIFVLALQRSYFGRYYYVNIYVYTHGVFSEKFAMTKEIARYSGCCTIDVRTPQKYDASLDLDLNLDDSVREINLKKMFQDFILPFSKLALTKVGIKQLAENGAFFLTPSVKDGLEKLLNSDIQVPKVSTL